MKKFMQWMTDVFAPKMNKMARNPWVSSVQDSIMVIMPIILIGSFATLFGVLQEFVDWVPDLSYFSNFSFGLMSLFLAYLIPNTVMEKKRHRRVSKHAGLAGITFFLLVITPSFDDLGNITMVFSSLGSGGMIAALLSGLFVAAIFNLFAKKSFFGEESTIPDFITVWFDTLIPFTLVILVGWVFTVVLNINLSEVILAAFNPFLSIGQSFFGFVLLTFLAYSFLYTFGISTWVIYPVLSAIYLQGIGDNMSLVAAGQAAQYIHTSEALTFVTIGGGGATLALNIMMLKAKSKKLKIIGRSTIIPSIFNINEPIIFGAPVAFNPILMVPMWILGLIMPMIVYAVMHFGLVPIPASIFGFWYLPSFIAAPILTKSISGFILIVALFALSWIVYLPFFKIYDKQMLEEEMNTEKGA